MSVRYGYNQQVTPPAPFVHVTLSRPIEPSAQITQVPALIDTGADLSVIPLQIAVQLQLMPLEQIAIEGFGGVVMYHNAFMVDVTIHDLPATTICVPASAEESYMLLGRDVLNRFELLLHGPKQFFELR